MHTEISNNKRRLARMRYKRYIQQQRPVPKVNPITALEDCLKNEPLPKNPKDKDV